MPMLTPSVEYRFAVDAAEVESRHRHGWISANAREEYSKRGCDKTFGNGASEQSGDHRKRKHDEPHNFTGPVSTR